MNEYRIYVNATANAGRWVTVEAESEDDATDMVDAMAFDGDISFDWEIDDVACDQIKVREFTESELAKIENERQRRAGQLELWGDQS